MAFKDKKTPSHEKGDSEMIRRFKSNPFVFIGTFVILVIVIVAFVLVPAIVPNTGGGNLDLTFGYYDKIPINYVPGNYFAQYYDMIARYQQNTMNSENNTFAMYQVWRQAFEAAVVHTAMLQEMKKSGYTAPAKAVDRQVARLPQFQENGRFSPALYRQLDNSQQLALLRQMRDDLTKEHFRADVTGLLKPAAEVEFIKSMASRQRSFDMAVFSVEDYPDAEYEAYAREHADLFRSVHLSIITVNSSEREAQQILDSVKSGETTFEDAARAHSTGSQADRGGDMGVMMMYELTQQFPAEDVREKLLALAKGGYSDVITTMDLSWSIFRAEESIQEADLTDTVVMEKVRTYVRNFERGRMEDWATANADSFITLVNETSFDEALAGRGMEKRSFGPIPVNYGSIDLFTTIESQSVTELAGSASDENFWKTAFTTPVNTPSPPLVQGSNVLVLFPAAETVAEESALEGIASTYDSYWLTYMTEQSIQRHFINSPKMEDRFMDVYFRYFMPSTPQ